MYQHSIDLAHQVPTYIGDPLRVHRAFVYEQVPEDKIAKDCLEAPWAGNGIT